MNEERRNARLKCIIVRREREQDFEKLILLPFDRSLHTYTGIYLIL